MSELRRLNALRNRALYNTPLSEREKAIEDFERQHGHRWRELVAAEEARRARVAFLNSPAGWIESARGEHPDIVAAIERDNPGVTQLDLWHKIRAAISRRRAVETRRRAAQRPEAQLRQMAFAYLRKLGFRRERASGGSAYYAGIFGYERLRVRVSDHRVPMTDARAYAADNGGFTWADADDLVITPRTTRRDVMEWLVTVRREVRAAVSKMR